MKKTLAIWAGGWVLAVASAWAQGPLPSNVAFQLTQVGRTVERAEKSLAGAGAGSEASKIESARAAAADARAGMAEIARRYGGKYAPDHPEIVAMERRIAALEAAAGDRAAAAQSAGAAAAEQAAAAGAASGDWLAKLRPFTVGIGQPGHDAAKHLVPSATQETAEMQKRLAIFAEASAALEEYRRANLGALETDELRQVAADLAAALRRFGESCVEYAGMDLAEAETRLGQLEQFVREQDAHMAAAEPVLYPDRSELENVQTVLDRAAGLVRSDDPRFAALVARLAALKQADARLRAARAADTRLRPDAYAGRDAAELKAFAEQVVARAQPGIRLLKTVLVSADWQEESVVEWTDTTQTALRHRTTRSLTAQVAGRLNANTRLYTLDIRQDRLSGGAWGPTQGHVMFTDPMLEENAKQAP